MYTANSTTIRLSDDDGVDDDGGDCDCDDYDADGDDDMICV